MALEAVGDFNATAFAGTTDDRFGAVAVFQIETGTGS